jgi:phosphatidylserine/phosphatidylglycerophosphate/cardiolipin synthase-like enzyme
MKDAGIPVKIDDTRHHMHHKFAIVDKEILVNGSYNWTRSADEYNHENLIITKDEALVKDFTQEFKKLWNEFDSLK